MFIIRSLVTLLFVFTVSIYADDEIVVRAPTKFIENGKSIRLEIVIFKPEGPGPFPTLVFNHGSTGLGNNPAVFKKTVAPDFLADIFTTRGWLVAFPQRRGRGDSDGRYDEGFKPDRSRYSCIARYSLPGLDRAVEDLNAAVEYLKTRSDVSTESMIVAGNSRGGILSIVYAGIHPEIFKGAINFVGGWIGEACWQVDEINTNSFIRGAGFQKPTLWLYGEHDSYYSMAHSRKNFKSFVAAGGRGSFHAFSLGGSRNGHDLIFHTGLWIDIVDAYIGDIR
ncbi:MAG: prolyl oligopeptidase family serine peptidase [Desulfobacteraceae bacterium]|nr:prolyl oligopeptidase family serine peptidase [Desulfobacteraceae bacterium]